MKKAMVVLATRLEEYTATDVGKTRWRGHLELGLQNTQKHTLGETKLPTLGSHNKIKYLPRPQ